MLPPLKETIEKYGLRAKKSLGQNFLMNPSVLKKIVDSAGPLEGRTVIEVGPGPGGLTRQIIEKAPAQFFAIERDNRCIEAMEELKATVFPAFNIIEGDALKVDCSTLGQAPRRIIANLPYNISVPLLIGWLEKIDSFESLTLMFQKEVAKRLVAKPRTSDYGRLSIITQWACHVNLVFDLPPGAFSPAPKVTSTVVHLTPRADRERISFQTLEKVTAAAFNQRRKMLRSSLKSLTPDPLPLLDACGIAGERRAEELTIDEFIMLAKITS